MSKSASSAASNEIGSKNRQLFLAALTILISTVLTLIVLEAMARAVARDPAYLYVPSDNARLIYELNPQHPEINSFGMRQVEMDRSILQDHFVIAVIGDSHAYSANSARRENSFPARLEHHLTTLSGKRIKVLNFGVPGYNMAQELEVLKVRAFAFKPDLIVLQYCINDEHISSYIQPKHVWLNHALHKSVLISRVWQKLLYSRFGQRYLLSFVEEHAPDLLLFSPGLVGTPRSRDLDPAHAPHPPRSREQVPARYHDLVGWENLVRDVRAFGRIATDAGIRALATGFIEDKNRNLYETAGFKVHSFFDIFDGLHMRDFGYDPANTATHFSDNGSDLIGNALARYISSSFALSKLDLGRSDIAPSPGTLERLPARARP